MPPITARTFVDGLEAMTVAGVTRSYTRGPPRGATATCDMPAMFIYGPELDGNRLVYGSQGGSGALRANIAILIEPVVQNLQGVNIDAAIDMVDALESALYDASCAIGGVLSWRIYIDGNWPLAEIQVWAVIAEIEGRRW